MASFISGIPWITPQKNMDFDKTLTILVIAVSMFLLLYSVGAGGDLLTIFQQNTNIVYILFMLAFSYTAMTMKPTVYGGLGTDANLRKGILFGAIIAAVMVISAGLKLATPLASTLSSSEILAAFYIALIIPFAEEKFFGQSMPFILNRTIGNPMAALVISSIMFGLFHLIAYGSNMTLIFAAIGFRFMATFGNSLLQTSSFGLTIHYINNISTVAKGLM